MYNIGDKVIDKNGRIFSIESVENKDFGKGPEPYFVLSPSFDYDFNPGYHAYIPQSKADVLLRHILSKDEAIALIDSFPSLDTYSEVSPRERKIYFTKVIASGDRTDILRVIKTLNLYKEERMRDNKPFSDFDRRLLQSLKKLLDNEFSLALSIPVDEVNSFISNRISTKY